MVDHDQHFLKSLLILEHSASVLAENISDWKGALHNIELFNIRGNEIGDKGAKCLAQCFQTHTQIRVVDVSSNGIKAMRID